MEAKLLGLQNERSWILSELIKKNKKNDEVTAENKRLRALLKAHGVNPDVGVKRASSAADPSSSSSPEPVCFVPEPQILPAQQEDPEAASSAVGVRSKRLRACHKRKAPAENRS